MPPRPRRAPSTRRSAARRLVWAQLQTTLPFAALGFGAVDLLQTYKAATGASVAGVTVMRTHLVIAPRTVAAADRTYIGIRVMDLDDIVAPPAIAASSNPRDNPYVDWALSRMLVADVNLTMGASPSGSYSGAIVDLRAKRRMHQVQQTWGLSIVTDSGAAARTFDIFARTLLALP